MRSQVDERSRLLLEQTAFLQALVDSQPCRADFDASRLQAAARALARKRCGEAAKAWPSLARWLGEDFPRRFAAYARSSPLPSEGGPLADGWAFANHCARAESLPNEVRLARFAVQLRFVRAAGGLLRRRRPAVKLLLLRQSSRLLVGLWWPFGRAESTVRIKSIEWR